MVTRKGYSNKKDLICLCIYLLHGHRARIMVMRLFDILLNLKQVK